MQAQCSGTTKAGSACRAPAQANGFCVSHDPDRNPIELAEWRSQGGKGKSNRARAAKDLPNEPLSTAEVHAHLSTAFRRALAGKLDPPLLNALSSAGRTLAELQKSSEIESRLADLERRLAGRVS